MLRCASIRTAHRSRELGCLGVLSLRAPSRGRVLVGQPLNEGDGRIAAPPISSPMASKVRAMAESLAAGVACRRAKAARRARSTRSAVLRRPALGCGHSDAAAALRWTAPRVGRRSLQRRRRADTAGLLVATVALECANRRRGPAGSVLHAHGVVDGWTVCAFPRRSRRIDQSAAKLLAGLDRCVNSRQPVAGPRRSRSRSAIRRSAWSAD
jgi:hypothetical protein